MWNVRQRATADCKRRPPTSCRRGFAVKELLVVMAAAGSGWMTLQLLDPLSDEQRRLRAGELTSLVDCEVPLNDEFVCVVGVNMLRTQESSEPPYFVSRLKFVSRTPEAVEAFLMVVTIEESTKKQTSAKCSAWSFVEADAVLRELNERHDPGLMFSGLSDEQRLATLLQVSKHELRSVDHLEDSLWRCVPPELQQTGLLAVTHETRLDALREFDDFPLNRLAAAIRAAARNNGWTQVDPRSLYPEATVSHLSVDERRALAQSLVFRLLADLPADR